MENQENINQNETPTIKRPSFGTQSPDVDAFSNLKKVPVSVPSSPTLEPLDSQDIRQTKQLAAKLEKKPSTLCFLSDVVVAVFCVGVAVYAYMDFIK